MTVAVIQGQVGMVSVTCVCARQMIHGICSNIGAGPGDCLVKQKGGRKKRDTLKSPEVQ